MGTVDEKRVFPEEISVDAPSVSVWISQIIQIWDGRQKVAVEIQKPLFGGIYTDNLIKSTCFYLKSIRIHEFFLNLSQICMFCDENSSKLATESTHSGVPWVVQCQQPNKRTKREDLIIEQKVGIIWIWI